MARLSAELYHVLCQAVSGEAMAVVRSVEDCKGFVAWYHCIGSSIRKQRPELSG